MSTKANTSVFKPGAEVRLQDGRVSKLVREAKDAHVPAWYLKDIHGAVPTDSLTLVTKEVQP